MLESIERLRKAVIRWKGTETWETAGIGEEFNGYVDAIEREIAERYGPLPLNADEGVERRREFVRLDISMIPCGYMHGGKAPYYSIVYRENGELFQGYSSFNIDTVSCYLRDYFMTNGKEV